MFDDLLLDKTIERVSEQHLGPHLRIGIRANWYRALPYAAMQNLKITFDAEPIDADQLMVDRPEGAIALADLQASPERWPVHSPLKLLIPCRDDVGPGTHVITVEYGMRITDLVFGGAAVIEPARASTEAELS